MPNRTLRLGLAQMESVPADVRGNLDVVAQFVEKAEQEEVNLLVFPELAICGYPVGDWCHQASIRNGDSTIETLRKLSKKMDIVVGLIEETEDVEFFNSGVYFSDEKIRHVHRKIYLPNYRHFDERRHFMSGWGIRAFDTPWCRIAILICGDAWHLSLPYMAAQDGADVLLILAASSREGLSKTIPSQEAWTRMNQSYALTLSAFVAFSNLAGERQGLKFYGASHVVLPDGNLLAQATVDRSDLLVTELDLSKLRQQRLILPFRRDDSLALTIDLGRRVLARKARRRNGLISLLGAPRLDYGLQATDDTSADDSIAAS